LSQQSASKTGLSRRHFILGGLGITGALVVGWGLMPPRQRLHGRAALNLGEGSSALNGWVTIGVDGSVGVVVAKSEMGQGVTTALPMLVAEELDVPMSAVRLLQAPIDKIYGDTSMLADGLPFHPDDRGAIKRVAQWLARKAEREVGVMATGGSSSIKDSWLPMREAGAAARARLLATAALRWKVSQDECTTEAGFVIHRDGRKLGYGALAAEAAQMDDVPFTLKAPTEFKLIGKSTPRLDLADKINGRAQFGMDIRLPGLIHAAIAMCPVSGGSLKSFDSVKLSKMPGVIDVVALPADRSGAPEAVAVLAKSWWLAHKALSRLSVVWDEGGNAKFSDAKLFAQLKDGLDQESGFTYFSQGSGEAPSSAKKITAEYRAPLLAHAAMEPVNCTAQLIKDQLSLWVPTQVPSIAVSAAARALGLSEDQVTLHMTYLGGGFGRRLETDMVVQAALLARAAKGAPVRLVWSREDDMAHDFYRPAAITRLSAALDASGRVVHWESHSASGAPVQQMLARAFGLAQLGPDKTTVEGLHDHCYEIPSQRASHVKVDAPVALGSWRSVGHSPNAFFKESFIDELALAAGQDPLSFRRQMLHEHPRHLAVLEAAVAKAGKPAEGREQGIALHQSFGSIVAQVAEVSVTDGRIQVHRISCAIDCGRVVNPLGVTQQIESAIAYGLSAALHGEIQIRDGRVVQRNFHDYPMLRLREMPQIDVEIMQSEEAPEGAGEPGTPPVAPAVANAVFKITGQRLRSLPLKLG
jgi:isoquinoline 1-oxidoreductase beta subunit